MSIVWILSEEEEDAQHVGLALRYGELLLEVKFLEQRGKACVLITIDCQAEEVVVDKTLEIAGIRWHVIDHDLDLFKHTVAVLYGKATRI